MSFSRLTSEKWHKEIPGARWFRGDLHIHTIDDHVGGRAKMPNGISGDPKDPDVLSSYVRRFLQGVIAKGIQAVGLTPHSPRLGSAPEISVTWKIIDEWNSGIDDDDVPFRDKIYAVFPGFEPSLNNGRQGLHLLFLFDPEIGQEKYLKLFDLVMGGVSPWREKTLQISNKTAEEVFTDMHKFWDRECLPSTDGAHPLQYLVLAPHIDAEKGLLGAQKAQVLQLFDHVEIAGLELGDEKLPEVTILNRPWLKEGMAKHRQAFFHSSDAYTVDQIGQRHTWFKLASPRVEALRQAFIASDSRIRLGFCRDENGALCEINDPPDVTVNARPWLKRVSVHGRASFFGVEGNGVAENTFFELSPDLTCVIGGSMTGKSTFLDGLRVYVDAPLPQDSSLRQQVQARARERFLAGSAEVELTCPGQDPTAPLYEQWPAVFFGQNELQRLAGDKTAVEEILARLVPAETDGIQERQQRLQEIDQELKRIAKRLAELDQQVVDAEQACSRARIAKDDLAGFSQAGIGGLHQAGRSFQAWKTARGKVGALCDDLEGLLGSVSDFDLPEVDADLATALTNAEEGFPVSSLAGQWKRIGESLESTKIELESWASKVTTVLKTAESCEQEMRITVEHKLVELGFDANRLQEFQALNRQASLLTSYAANLDEAREKLKSSEKRFGSLKKECNDLLCDQRSAFDRVLKRIEADFEGRIRATRSNCGNTQPLDDFLRALSQRGITRWWNDLEEDEKPSPHGLVKGLADNAVLEALGMTSPVQETFVESLTKAKQRTLTAIRCPDSYHLELRLEDESYRPLDRLSGGQMVSVLLSLLLETTDNRPLVIDQPEDQLDNRFLFETVLPALKRLKGRRQVIVVTHNANIVVNGDADMVIQLEATANHGHIAQAGAIEEPAVRDAIVRTVDGGDEAFRLRHVKYGF